MIRKISASILVVVLLAACSLNSTPTNVHEPLGPGPYPAPGNPDNPTSSDQPPGTNPYPSPLYPIPGEDKMTRGEITFDSTDILVAESFPPQITLVVKGSLPTPCHQLRATLSHPDAQNRIHIELYSLTDPEEICAQVIQPYETHIPLGGYMDGKYTIWLNGEQVQEFTTP